MKNLVSISGKSALWTNDVLKIKGESNTKFYI